LIFGHRVWEIYWESSRTTLLFLHCRNFETNSRRLAIRPSPDGDAVLRRRLQLARGAMQRHTENIETLPPTATSKWFR
jgi:hypothetical protein